MCSFRTVIRSHAAGFHWLKWMSFGYGPSVRMTGYWPSSAGRNTLASTLPPSRTWIGTSFSTRSRWNMPES